MDLADLPEWGQEYLRSFELPRLPERRCSIGPTRDQRRVALVSTAGLHLRTDRPFSEGSADFRIVPQEADSSDLVLTHVSVNFDRLGFTEDPNVLFPVDRLKEMASDGEIAAVASEHFSFMGATAPEKMRPAVRKVAERLMRDDVNVVLLVPS